MIYYYFFIIYTLFLRCDIFFEKDFRKKNNNEPLRKLCVKSNFQDRPCLLIAQYKLFYFSAPASSNGEKKGRALKLKRFDRQIKKPIVEILLQEEVKKGTMAEIELQFSGVMWEGAAGLFRGSYNDKNNETRKFVATHLRPNEARRVFPCFDEPALKALYCVRIARPKNLKTLFVTPLKETKPM